MSRPRLFTPEKCQELAEWYLDYAARETFADKARELGVTKGTLRNAIDRGLGKDDGNLRQKLSEAEIQELENTLAPNTNGST